MKLFFDFDDTLFDTQAFARGAQAIFSRHGISEELFQTSYRAIRDQFSERGWCYSFEEHLKGLRAELGDRAEFLRTELESYMADTSAFIFPDVVGALSHFRSHGHRLFILSFGDASFQRKKVEHSGIVAYFDDVFVTADNKGVFLVGQHLSAEEVCFFDDQVTHIEDVKKSLPFARTILVRRPHKEHRLAPNASCDVVVADLSGTEILRVTRECFDGFNGHEVCHV